MSKRIKIMILSVVIIIGVIATYLMFTYQLKEAWLKDYLYEVYGGQQWVKVGEDGRYYAINALSKYTKYGDRINAVDYIAYEDGIFKAKKTREYCLQPERNYYEGDDIFITTDKKVYKYKRDRVLYTITNNSDKTIWPASSCVDNINFVYDIEISINGKWYAIFLYDAFSQEIIVYKKINPGETLEERIPIHIMGFPNLSGSKSGKVAAIPNYFELCPGLYRLSHQISLLPKDEGLDLTYITCTFEVK